LLRPNLIEPNGVQDGKEPAIHPAARLKLCGAFNGAHTGCLHQIIGNIPLMRKHQAVAPQA
jgi:hypothetical protein